MMKRIKKVSLIFFSLLSFCSINSCTQDDLGDSRDNLVKTWRCQEQSELFGVQYYDVEISKSDSDELQILMYNFFDRKKDVLANLDGNALSIPKQTVDGWDIEGSGEISADLSKISWTFTADDGTGVQNISAYFTEKSPVALNLLTEN